MSYYKQEIYFRFITERPVLTVFSLKFKDGDRNMSLFGKQKTAEEKNQELFEKYGLDIENYNEKAIKAENSKNLKAIAQDLSGMGLTKLSVALSMSPGSRAEVSFLSAIFQSNLILIRKNELIIRSLEKLANKK